MPRTRPASLDDPTWLRARYATDRTSARDLARELGVSPATFMAALRRSGVAVRPLGHAPRKTVPGQPGLLVLDRLADAAWLRRRYADEHASQRQIAAEIGAAQSQVSRALRLHGIATAGAGRPVAPPSWHRPVPGGSGTVGDRLGDRAWLRRRLADGPTVAGVGGELGVGVAVVLAAARRHRLVVPGRRSWADRVGEQALRAEHRDHGVAGTARRHGVSLATVRAALDRHGIVARRPKTPPPVVHGRAPDAVFLAEHKAGRTPGRIAAAHGVDLNTVKIGLERLGVPCYALPGPLADADWVRRRIADGATADQLAAELGTSARKVRAACARHGVVLATGGPRVLTTPADRDRLVAAAARARSADGVAAAVGVSRNTAVRALAKHGLTVPVRTAAGAPYLDDPAWLRARYEADGLNLRQVAVLAGLGPTGKSRVGQALLRHGITIRKPSRRPDPAVLPGGGAVPGPSAPRKRRAAPVPALLADPRWLARRLRAGRSWLDVATELDVPVAVVSAAAFRHGLA